VKSVQRRALDVYAVLGADRSASWTELRRSYRSRARELHPDVQAHRPTPTRLDQSRATALFTQLQQAWSLVATPERRAAYDHQFREPAQAQGARSSRPASAPGWAAGPEAGVLLRTGPGDLHIAIPGGSWDLSLAEFLRHTQLKRKPPLVIGDVPPHLALRQALQAADFVERLRLTTMVGLREPIEDRGGPGSQLDDDGVWKLAQLGRALNQWSRSLPSRRDELPYGADLRLMGRLSLDGYEINLPHPGGIYTAIEPRPLNRVETRSRGAQPVLDVRLPPLPLALVAAWAQDRTAIEALRDGWAGLARLGQLDGAQLAGAQRSLEGKRLRRDGHDPLQGSALDGGPMPAGLVPLLRTLPDSAGWLAQLGGPLPGLPWGEPHSLSGEDRSLSDAATRLLGRILDRLLTEPPPGLRLVAMRGSRLRFRVEAEVDRAREWIGATVSQGLADHVGFPATAEVTRP